MKKKHIIDALKDFDDEDNLTIEDCHLSLTPKFHKVCGKTQDWMPYYCVLEPDHEGDCWCMCKQVNFTPDK
jgi:hypothetical protein